MGDEEIESLTCCLCGNAAKQRCSACKNVTYCSREHQKQDWKSHKVACKPPPYIVCSSEELGRHLVASRDLKAGEVIISEGPVVAGPKQISPPLCLGCHSSQPCARCPRCLWPLCSAACPGRDVEHAAECIALAGACAPIEFGLCQSDDPHHAYEAITVLRCVLLQRRSPRRWKQLTEMEAHEKERKNTDAYKENQIRVVGFLRNFVGLSGWDTSRWDVSEATLHRICGVLDVNALDVRIAGNTELQALYATASLLEHSCMPNVRLSFDQSLRLTVSAAVPIAQGEHIKTMYTHALWGTMSRREHLIDNKYFRCKCERCADPTELGTFLSNIKCVADCEDSYLLPVNPLDENSDWVCTGKCGGTLSANHVAELVLRLGDEVENALARPDVPSLEKLITRLSQLLHPQHYHQYAIQHSLVQILGRGPTSTETEERRKLTLCQRLLDVTRSLDPAAIRLASYEAVLCIELHAVRLQLARRNGDPEVLMKESRAARELLERAVHVLRFEPEYLPEGKLALVAKTALSELNACIEKMKSS